MSVRVPLRGWGRVVHILPVHRTLCLCLRHCVGGALGLVFFWGLLKSARCARACETTSAMLYMINDYANLGKTAGLESGLKTLWGGTHIGPLDGCGHADATLRDATRVVMHMRHV